VHDQQQQQQSNKIADVSSKTSGIVQIIVLSASGVQPK
jgi:hypothetical protein